MTLTSQSELVKENLCRRSRILTCVPPSPFCHPLWVSFLVKCDLLRIAQPAGLVTITQ
jgi:hypothetical protein